MTLFPLALRASLLLPALLAAQVAITPPGQGSAADPYRIATLDHLFWLTQTPAAWDDTIVQVADIDAARAANWDGGKGFSPIGSEVEPFRGSYNGKGFRITGLAIHRPAESEPMGFFGVLGGGARVDSLFLLAAQIEGGSRSGVLVGRALRARIAACHAFGRVAGGNQVGGLVGALDSGRVFASSADVAVSGDTAVGGLIGQAMDSVVRSYAVGAVQGIAKVGGVVGAGRFYMWICYARGAVTGVTEVGGVAGHLFGKMSISDIYAAGAVRGIDLVGGLLGRADSGVWLTTSSWDVEASGVAAACGAYVGKIYSIGMTTAQMKSRASFSSWNSSNFWWIDEGKDYPKLRHKEQTLEVPELPKFMILGAAPRSTGIRASSGLPVAHISGDSGVAIGVVDTFRLLQPGKAYFYFRQDGDSAYLPVSTMRYSHEFTVLPKISPAGDGTPESPYRIATFDDLGWIGLQPASWSKHFVQVADIDATPSQRWTRAFGYPGGVFPIGDSLHPFTGTYRGTGRKIRGLRIGFGFGRVIGYWGGLFGAIDSGAAVDSVNLVDATLDCWEKCGTLAGMVRKSAIRDCAASGVVTAGTNGGGLVGYIEDGTISGSRADGTVSASSYNAGGLVGKVVRGTIDRSFSTAAVKGNTKGGLVGYNLDGTISRSFASGAVTQSGGAGGLVGMNTGLIRDCYATGPVGDTGWRASPSGGLVNNNSGRIERSYAASRLANDHYDLNSAIVYWNSAPAGSYISCYWDAQATRATRGMPSDPPTDSLPGLSPERMRAQASFVGWDFADTWGIVEGITRPYLRGMANAQEIVFDSLPASTYGDSDLVLAARASSGLPVVFASSDTAVAAIVGSRARLGDVGTATISAGQAGDSLWLPAVATRRLSVVPKPLDVRVDTLSKVYGESDPAFIPKAPGLVPGDSLRGSAERLPGENAGIYPIFVGTLSAGRNYRMRFLGGGFEIVPAPLRIVAHAQRKSLGAVDPELTYADSGLLGADTLAGGLVRDSGDSVGAYAIRLGTLDAGANYELLFTGDSLRIDPIPVSLAPRGPRATRSTALSVDISRPIASAVAEDGAGRLAPAAEGCTAEECLSVDLALPGPANVSVAIFDHLGTPVISWYGSFAVSDLRRFPLSGDGRRHVPLAWNLRARNGAAVAPGLYLWKIEARTEEGQKLETVERTGVTR